MTGFKKIKYSFVLDKQDGNLVYRLFGSYK